ncbi:SRF-type transcription factor (DNA-binding and dimerization domain)-domain-containing protein [Auriculariales sp. MPI-PUGE-AT-0066]|nr:SRF-type transcription factor (DNA-binding and dimerization domain)-domain-containing protein [Auriculariales sp. MPI-PUGE-AT-0066]
MSSYAEPAGGVPEPSAANNSRKRARTNEFADAAAPASGGGMAFQQEAGDGDSEDEEGRDKKTGRRKIKIEFIQDKSRRHITFSKRKAGIMKKAYELSTLTGTQVLLLVVSETGLVYTFTTAKLQPLVTQPEGKNLIQACLNAPPPAPFPINAGGPPPQQMPPPSHQGMPQGYPPHPGMHPQHRPEDDDDRSVSPAHSQQAASLNASSNGNGSSQRNSRPRRATAGSQSYRDGSEEGDSAQGGELSGGGGSQPGAYANGGYDNQDAGHAQVAYGGIPNFPQGNSGDWSYGRR